MAQSVLGSLTLGYRPLWNRARALAGVQLYVHEDDQGIDGQHLLRTLAEMWSAESPALMLSPHSPGMLAGLLGHAGAADAMIEVPVAWLDEPATRSVVQRARQRGARMIVSGTPQRAPDVQAAGWFVRRMLTLSTHDAALALQAALQTRHAIAAGRMVTRADSSPVLPDALIDGVASRVLADHALDQQGAWALAEWPVEDVLHSHRGHPMPPMNRAIVQTMNAIDDEPSLDRIEQLFGQDPALAYRLLLYLNSAGLGIRAGVATLRHGFMMLGFRALTGWLAEQLAHASDDAGLRPVNAAMVLRGHLMEQLMDAGIEQELRREVYLCGLFAQLDRVLDEPLRTALSRVPLTDRIVSAVVSGTGPYAGSLQIAVAMEGDNPASVRALRTQHEMSAEEVNRALLRMLASQAS